MTTGGWRALGAASAWVMAAWAGVGVGAGAATATGSAGTSAPVALRMLEPGQWELRGRGEGAETRRLCVTDLRQLLQLRHNQGQRQALCRSFTISDSPHAVSVTYDCAAAGNGRTDLRVETARLVQIRSQGVADGAPFAFAAEGRRIGACG
ncbi:hypothetical protein Q4610_03310 [Sphingobium sp. HBC34]|uniref:DUF3617 family protein n=1 Tax=Sphingobium cyanobacteriorum TaxID=3063954 RepID=A0ABT8ZHQ4_9SPHN|nr:hypothetical protein [Sphingobium sp. HBC34]MDO7834064.1 hypothetical protein [Sphingobium sp. HBC34]